MCGRWRTGSKRRGDDSRKGRALYCLGRNQFNDGDFPAAIVTYTKALEHSVKAADTLRVARICQDMARTCNASGNSTDEMMYLARAAEAYKVVGFQRESQQALLEIGQAESGLGRYDAAESIFKSVLFDAHEMRDTLLEARCLESYAALAMSRDTLDRRLPSTFSDEPPASCLSRSAAPTRVFWPTPMRWLAGRASPGSGFRKPVPPPRLPPRPPT